MAGFDIVSTATNAVDSVKNKITSSGLATNLSSQVSQTAGQIAGAANKVAGQVSNLIKDPLGAMNIDLSKLLKAPSMIAVAASELPAPPYPNVLNAFSSYTYILTIGVLDDNALNNPDTTYKAGIPQQIICKSAAGDPNNRVSTEYGKFDFFIDNLTMESIFGFQEATGNTNATTFSFTVTEPYSMGLFFESVSIAAINAGNKNYLEAPYLLTIEFKGFTEQNEVIDLPALKKYIPFKFREMSMKVTGKGATYNIEAYAWNDGAFSDKYNKNKTDISISGKSVKEILQSGEKSLQKVVNQFYLTQAAKGIVNVPDKVLIIFPQDISSASSNASTAPETVKEDDTSATADTQKTNPAAAELYKKLGVVSNSAGDNLVQDDKICNAIGQASLGFSQERKGEVPVAKESVSYDEFGNIIRGNVDSQNDPSITDMKFRQDTDIVNAINQVILQSDYARQALKGEMIDDKGMIPWWRVDTQMYQVPTDENLPKTGTKPRLVVYRVVPYRVHAGKFMPPGIPAPGIKQLKQECMKEYNYIYTGKNIDVLDFDITINAAFNLNLSADNNTNNADTEQQKANSGVDKPETESVPATGAAPLVQGSLGSKVSHYATQTSTDKLGGGGTETLEVRLARQFHDAIISAADMMTVDMKILGDPYYLSDSGIGNYTAQATGYQNLNSDGAVDYQSSEVDIIVNFRTPTDINQKAGMYDFAEGRILLNYSGLFKVLQVTNSFAGGKFTQVLHLNRRGLQEVSETVPDIDATARAAFPTEVAPGPTDEEIEAYRESLGDFPG